MSLLAFRSVKYETTGITLGELCLGRNLKPLDLLCGNPLGNKKNSSEESYVSRLKQKLNKIHSEVRQRLNMKSLRAKALYDRKARRICFESGQKV